MTTKKGQINSVNVFWNEYGSIQFTNVGWNGGNGMPTEDQRAEVQKMIKDIEALVLKVNKKLAKTK